MKKVFKLSSCSICCHTLLVLFFVLFSYTDSTLYGQGEDCVTTEMICDGSPINFQPTGPGIDDFAGGTNDGCLSGENFSAWYFFELGESTPANTILTFVITPQAGPGGRDYDFAVWGPTTAASPIECGNLGAPLRCSWSDNETDTGLSTIAGDFTEGAGGDAFVQALTVNAGEGYWLLVDNFSSNSNGFDLVWNVAGQFLDCAMDPECGVDFNDPGGTAGNYMNSLNEEYVICPDSPGDAVTIEFENYDIDCSDALVIRNGPGPGDPILANLCGADANVSFTSTHPSGCLYLNFTSDAAITANGWKSFILCEPLCQQNCTETSASGLK